jgi:hypothetical protein
MPLTAENHYVPCLYLKHFASPDGTLYRYRILVSNPHVSPWKRAHVSGVGYQTHLYTRVVLGAETDDIERWLEREFDTPATAPIRKAIEDERLRNADWQTLIRFVAAQIVRTPAFLAENLPLWNQMMPTVLNEVLQDLRRELERARQSGGRLPLTNVPNTEYLPLRVKRLPDGESVKISVHTVVGRGVWLHSMKYLLTDSDSVKALLDHRWSILRAPNNLNWFSSDDPVVRLNYHSEDKYDFDGGWGSKGTEIFLPLSPRHLLYTRIGYRPPERGFVLPRAAAEFIRRAIAEHAHRNIFSNLPNEDIPKLRPRHVDAEIFRKEREGWRKWHEDQTKAEEELTSE